MIQWVNFNRRIPTTLALLVIMWCACLFVWWYFNFRSYWLVQEETSTVFVVPVRAQTDLASLNLPQKRIVAWNATVLDNCPGGMDFCPLTDLKTDAVCADFAYLKAGISPADFAQSISGVQSGVLYGTFPDMVVSGGYSYLMTQPYLKIGSGDKSDELAGYLEKRCETKAGIWPAFSADGAHYAIALCNYQGGYYLLADGNLTPVAGPVFEAAISPDGKRLAYITAELDNGFYQYFLHYEQSRSAGYDEIKELVFSSDSQHLAYIVKNKNRFYIFQDGHQQFGPYEQADNLVFSPNGEVLGFVGVNKGKARVYVNDQVRQELSGEKNNRADAYYQLILSERGVLAAFLGAEKNESGAIKECLYVNGQAVSTTSDHILALDISPDEQHLAFVVQEGAQYYLHFDGLRLEQSGAPVVLRNTPGCFKFGKDNLSLNYYQVRDDGIWYQRIPVKAP